MAGLACVLQGEELRVEAGELPHARTLTLDACHRSPREPLRRNPSRRGAARRPRRTATPRTAARPQGPVSFGTSGHRGTSLKGTFTEAHVLAISEAISRHRKAEGIDGPLFVARDTHALSEPAFHTAIEVFVAHGHRRTRRRRRRLHADARALATRSSRTTAAATGDGIVLTPSHNPPEDGGYKYNPPSGGPADTTITKAIEEEANRLIEGGLATSRRAEADVPTSARLRGRVRRRPPERDRHRRDPGRRACTSAPTRWAARQRRVLQGDRASSHGLNLEVVNEEVDPTFRFVPLDHDGKIRMDCSSPYVMSGLIELQATASTSPSPATRTPTATGSSRRAPGC